MLKRLLRLTAILASAAALATVPLPAHADTIRPADGEAGARCTKPVVYFDLGNVLIDSRDYTKMSYLPEAQTYVERLRSRKITMGLIVNIPAAWGTTDQERLDKLKQFIDAGWVGPTSFDWSYFGDRIFLPRTDAERKPAPVMFERGLSQAAPCPAIYQGEAAEEVAAAKRVGLRTYRVGQPGRSFYMPTWQL